MARKAKRENLPGTYSERVFVGGNYDFPATLRTLVGLVKRVGFTPVFPLDLEIPEEEIHDWDLRILHSCRYAIFEVTHAAGQLMEIERARDYGVKTLSVFEARGPGQREPAQVASMLRTSGQRLQGYLDDRELRGIVRSFLLEEEYVEAYRAAFQFEVEKVKDEMIIRPDGSATRKCVIKGLTGIVAQIHHEFSTTHGVLEHFDHRHIEGNPTSQWKLDEGRSQLDPVSQEGPHIEGAVLIGGEIKSPITYEITVGNSVGSIALTKDEMQQRYLGYSLPYEDLSREVMYPIRELEITVRLPQGHGLIARPAVFHGEIRQSEAMRPRKDSFTFDGECATFRLTWPCIFGKYMIYWFQEEAKVNGEEGGT